MDDNPQQPDNPSQTAPAARRGLGRGLAALIPGSGSDSFPSQSEVPIDRVRPSRMQPRTEFDSEPLEELRVSIQQHGVLQPILVRPIPDGQGFFEIVAGERRWRAAKEAGLRTIPVVIRSIGDQAALESALVENLQREDLNPVERAKAYKRLTAEFSLTQESLAKKVGRSQASIANTIRLLALPPEVCASLEAGRITEGHARALLTLAGTEALTQLWRRVESQGLSVRATESAARRATISREIARPRTSSDKDINNIEYLLTSTLGSPVKVAMKSATSGEIQISFFSLDDLDRLLRLLGRPQAAS